MGNYDVSAGSYMKGFIGVAAGVVTILGFFGLRTIFDLFPKEAQMDSHTKPPISRVAPSPSSDEGPDNKPKPPEAQTRRSDPQPTTTIPPSAASSPATSTEFTLGDGEQQVLLSGQAAVSTQFNQLGEESFLTLRISIGDETTSHAVLAPGARFPLRIEETQYYLSLLSMDFSNRTARIRIDRAF